jgi:AraC family transcriptional regulator, regulatory protein of adaptative response / methylated-DNA-[protein]-cysteine methyltransferase
MEHSSLEDYEKVQAVLAHLYSNWRDQPSLEDLASPVGLAPDQLQHLFTRWAGLTPKAFLQALTLDHASGGHVWSGALA